jgi:hypothetical protein
VERLFARFQAIYGSKANLMWADQEKADLIATWSEGLADVPTADVYAAVRRLPVAHPSWPPTLGEFLALCRPEATPAAHRALLPDRSRREPIDPVVLAKIKAALAKGRQRDPKAWAREILDEAARGEYRIEYGIAAAREALGGKR